MTCSLCHPALTFNFERYIFKYDDDTGLLMKTSNCSIMELDGCPWLILGRIQMDHNFSSQSRKQVGWMEDMSCLERFEF